MRIDDQRRSTNFEDRGTGRGGGGGGGLPVQALMSLVSLLGFKGTLLAGGALLIGLFVMPATVRQELLGALTGTGEGTVSTTGAGSVCEASQSNAAACDFSR